jgi:hypothetical protein
MVLLACTAAQADDTGSDLELRAPQRWHHDDPVLRIDPIPPLSTEGIGGQSQSETQILDLGPRARLVGEGVQWRASLSPQPAFGPEIDDMSRGWRASYALSYDLGLFSVGASLEYGHVDSRYERGTYRVVGLSAYRTFRLSRWMLAWFALSAGRQEWLGGPPTGEANASSVMLSIGTTFR